MFLRCIIRSRERKQRGLASVVSQLFRRPTKRSENRPNGTFGQFSVMLKTRTSTVCQPVQFFCQNDAVKTASAVRFTTT